MWVSGESWSAVRSSRRVHNAFQLLFHLTWPPDQKSPLMWMHFNNSDHQCFEMYLFQCMKHCQFQLVFFYKSVRLSPMKVEPTNSEVGIFQYTLKSNFRKLCLKFKTVRNTMKMDLNILCQMLDWNLIKMTFTNRQTILVLTSHITYTKAQ